jgi:UDP-N-acetylmuramate--alanine ligase
MVAEADESDGSFLRLAPVIAVITNVDREHLDHYGTYARLQQAFVEFANKVPFYGAVVACLDDAELRGLLPAMTRRLVTYGIDHAEADLLARDVQLEPFGSRCQVWGRLVPGEAHRAIGALHLRVPGRHNLLNALACIGVALELGVAYEQVAAALAEFRGAERRFQLLGEVDGVMVVDDYGHHPTEIAAVLAAARAGLERRLLVVFQPHRYSRTAQLREEFGAALAGADEVVLLDVYAAGEDPIPGATAESIAEAVRARSAVPVQVVRPLDAVAGEVARRARPGDIVITLGAGSIGTVGERILQALRATRAEAGERS